MHPCQTRSAFHWHSLIKISFALLFPAGIDRCLLSLPDTLHHPHHGSGLIHVFPLHIPSPFPLHNPCWCQGEHLLMLMTLWGREKVQARQKQKRDTGWKRERMHGRENASAKCLLWMAFSSGCYVWKTMEPSETHLTSSYTLAKIEEGACSVGNITTGTPYRRAVHWDSLEA